MINVGFVGIGSMGGALARRLIGKVELTVCDKDIKKLEEWDSAEINTTNNLANLSKCCDFVLLCLPTSDDVEAVTFGEHGLCRFLKAGSLIIDMTSGDPKKTKSLSSKIKALGIDLIDAPVSGGPNSARDGNIAIIVGGSVEEFERARQVLRLISSNVVHAGPVGAGHSIKLGNNLLNLICRIGTFEVVSMLVKDGVDPENAVRILNMSSGRNYATERTLPENILSGTMNQGFSTGLMAKDTSLALQIADRNKLHMKLGEVAQAILDQIILETGPQCDMSELARFYEKQTGARLRP